MSNGGRVRASCVCCANEKRQLEGASAGARGVGCEMTFRFDLSADDPVTFGLRASARRLLGVAAFGGVVYRLTLSGSLYWLQVYDRVIPSRNGATLLGLSAIVLFAYLLQGYFDA